MARIQPRTLKGFRDHLPSAEIPRQDMIDTITSVYRAYGFAPIDTPALEYTDILLGKGGAESDKQLFRFDDPGGRDVAMRFDLTVPLARFVAQHASELGMPFKRYHVGTVWRGENPQRGRYREFMQCDFDTIGTESVLADVETAAVIHDVFAALGIDAFTVRVNNRRVLNGLLEKLGVAESSTEVLRALDKLGKVGRDRVLDELTEIAGARGSEVLEFASARGANSDVIATIRSLVEGSETGERGVHELEELLAGVAAAGVPEERVVLDVSIARGLDYYTGSVFETYLDALPEIGSCCSGGRYDDLASLYTAQRLPGVGASVGVDRLLAALSELGLSDERQTPAPVMVAFFDPDRELDYLALAHQIRSSGIGVELYPEPRKLGAQLKYADRRGHRLALIVGPNEWAAETAQLKDLGTGESTEVALDGLIDAVRAALAPAQGEG